MMGDIQVTIVGAGLAGSEAAWQAAEQGAQVVLYEMRPARMTAAHQTGGMAELVCSNSLGSNLPDRALGMLKNEMRLLGSLIIRCADAAAVPAGGALAVDREGFSRAVTAAIEGHPRITVRRTEVTDLAGLLSAGQGPAATIIATGPLTSPTLAQGIRELAGENYLYFFDAMAPIVSADTVDMAVAFRQSRYDKSLSARRPGSVGDRPEQAGQAGSEPAAPSDEQPAGDYINCPLSRDEYFAFVEAVNAAEKISLREFEQDEAARRYFEGCLPIEVLAERAPMALAFGPMRPVGLRDPRTGQRPFAVVQLRQDDAAGTLYNLVGFQTNIKWGDQERVLRMIPGLADAEFVRFGQMHRNTFINSPRLLRPTLQWHDRERLFFAGQITGTEGYVGSAAGGLVAGLNAARVLRGEPALTLPRETMLGALLHYISHAESASFQPMKANFGLLPELEPPVRDKRLRYAAYAARGQAALLAAVSDAKYAQTEK
ncbi:MAG: Methylenetetrahydrofolate--tRNA-(uracil-5-)-methyltransferase TrmFO [Chloroflexi bacterium ADurb.Bin325]|nr:MAG: Methylenetetrahydrofolate--tRNA-(uracil-5-)-methyltransferase TrmFO [Chloroflexi bacterium ADurb.Bin325]